MKKTLSARVDSKTKEEVEKLAEERDNSISNMTQQLVREGIESETQSEPQSQPQNVKTDVAQNKLSWILLGIGVSFIILWLGFSIPSIVTIPISLAIAGGIVFDNIEIGAI